MKLAVGVFALFGAAVVVFGLWLFDVIDELAHGEWREAR